jgi:hypothetical protein
MSFAIELLRGKGKKKGAGSKGHGAWRIFDFRFAIVEYRSKKQGAQRVERGMGEWEKHPGLQDCKTAGPFTRRAIGNEATNS